MTATQKLAAELYWRMKLEIESAKSQSCDMPSETKPITLPRGCEQ